VTLNSVPTVPTSGETVHPSVTKVIAPAVLPPCTLMLNES
jgi:hypothetical protein